MAASNNRSYYETLDSHKCRQRPLVLKTCCGSRRICETHLGKHLEREIFPFSLSNATPNGSLRKRSAKFDLSKILQEDDCHCQSTISKVVFNHLFLHSFICKSEACTISKTRASVLSGYPNTEKQMKALGRRPSAFIVSRCLDTPIKHEARVLEITSQDHSQTNHKQRLPIRIVCCLTFLPG